MAMGEYFSGVQGAAHHMLCLLWLLDIELIIITTAICIYLLLNWKAEHHSRLFRAASYFALLLLGVVLYIIDLSVRITLEHLPLHFSKSYEREK
jgi:hypothetical protein